MTKECPECLYPMDKVVIKKGSKWKREIANMVCLLCNHSERTVGHYEYERACNIKEEGDYLNE